MFVKIQYKNINEKLKQQWHVKFVYFRIINPKKH